MGKVVFLLVLTVGMASPAMAAKSISVEQLEQLLAAAHGQSDGKVAKQLSGLELTEQASSVRLARWKADFPGRRSREALTELAGASAFLSLPAADVLVNAPPDRETQRAILDRTIDYVSKTVSRLPNFYATRQTEHFEDTPPREIIDRMNAPTSGRQGGARGIPSVSTGESEYVPMHPAGRSSVTVSYRDGFELRNSQKVDFGRQAPTTVGLTTSGEFGPILTVVLQDATPARMTWDHWQQGANGQGRNSQGGNGIEAVFRYVVPAEQSTYMVAIPHGNLTEQINPAYHGEIAIDPANGEILRITVVADLVPPYEMVKISLLVEYGAIPIGGKTYICPEKGVALSKMPVGVGSGDPVNAASPAQTQLNVVAFTDYHLFRSDARIVTGDSAANEESPAGVK
jgi:hypothetical protein